MSTLYSAKPPLIDNRIKFRHLQCFIEVVRQGGVSKAANQLALTQPAVSKKLRELEDVLGVTLIDRDKRGVHLTEYGEVFLRYALNSTDALREGIDRVQASNAARYAPIVVGVLPTIAAIMMPEVVRQFKTLAPVSDVTLLTGSNRMLMDALRLKELDLVVGRMAQPRTMKGLTFEQLYLERIAIIVRPGHPLAMQDNPPLSSLSEYPILMPTQESVIRAIVDRFMILNQITPNQNRIETISHAFGRAYVKQSNAVWLISHGAVMPDLQSGGLAEIQYDYQETTGAVGIAQRADSVENEVMSLFITQIRQFVGRNMPEFP